MKTPSDVLKTRIMSNPGLYKNTMDCLMKTVRARGGCVGFVWGRMRPKAMVFYLTFEQLRGVCWDWIHGSIVYSMIRCMVGCMVVW